MAFGAKKIFPIDTKPGTGVGVSIPFNALVDSLNIDSLPDINQINIVLKYNIADTGLTDILEIAFT